MKKMKSDTLFGVPLCQQPESSILLDDSFLMMTDNFIILFTGNEINTTITNAEYRDNTNT